MKNLKKLGFIFSAGTIAALSLVGCGDDDDSTTPAPSGGTASGGSSGSGTSGTGTSGTGTSGTGTSGTAAGGSSAGTATTGGGGTGGSTAGTGGSTGGSGGTTAGTGGSTGGGGAGGMSGGGAGGTGGGGAGGGGAGGGGGAPSADCSKWCSGAMGLIAQCAGKLPMITMPAPTHTETEADCIKFCTDASATGAMGLACWNMHLGFVNAGMDKAVHCPHAAGAKANGQCNVVPNQP